MAIIFAEQTETGSTTWCLDPGSTVVSTSNTAGTWSTYSWTAGDAHCLLTTPVSEFWGQYRIYMTSNAADSHRIFFRSVNNTTNVSLRMQSDSRLAVYLGEPAGGAFLGTSTTVFAVSQWYYIQFHFTIHDTTGVVDLKINGTSELALTLQDTRGDAAAGGDTCTRIFVDGGSGTLYDDFTMNDNTDTDNVTYPDNLGIEALMPNAAGDSETMEPFVPTVQRFYFSNPAVEAAAVSPSPGSLWDTNTLVDGGRRGLLSPARRGTAMGDLVIDNYATTQGDDMIWGQFVSSPLAAQTIDGTFKCYMRAREEITSDDFASQIVIRVVSQDGTTEQAVLYAGQTETSDPPTSEWTTTTTNRGFPRAGLLPASLTSYACANGDRLVVEVGARTFRTSGTATARDIRVGDAAASDLPENETSTSDFCPWIEFSDTIVLSSKGNWDYVNERPQNTTDYVFDSVVNDYDLYNLPATQWATVAGVVVPLRCQKSDAGAANIAHMIKYDTDADTVADTENTGSDIALSTSWTYHTKYYNRQPGPTSWSPAKVNALQVGAKVR